MDKLDTMRAFTVVVQENSFSKAADKLEISPQLVSKYVSSLEESLETRLLNRTTRKISVTEAGRAYYERCMQVLIDIEEMENSLANLHQNISGRLSVSAPMSFGIKHLPNLLAAFKEKYPDVTVDINLTDKKIDLVEEGVDVALRIGKLTSSSLIAKKITDIHICVCASPDYLQKFGEPKVPSELEQHRYLKYSYADSSVFLSGLANRKDTLNLKSHLTSNNGDILVAAAIAGEGIAIQPTFIAGEALANGKLKRILTDYEPEPLGLYAVYVNRKFLAGKVRSFIDFVNDFYEDVPYWDVGVL
ncbi:LysR substrate-binding domain-containing protein [Vibrio sp.]|uniref:LysR family transcriptional regulator n=1 Tax=Vibrio viridaestus TaxID=2487322 RepID=A0A3N9U4Y3_9VIBR|nr:LysR family transcriptional regulator [Vibrio viridaestus]MDC0609414.1 LysR substrate-binding domain-containing protein [Vibrio sp.]RQW64752.1 LysR family transcriptional regulator [Vibrio viridaestus]